MLEMQTDQKTTGQAKSPYRSYDRTISTDDQKPPRPRNRRGGAAIVAIPVLLLLLLNWASLVMILEPHANLDAGVRMTIFWIGLGGSLAALILSTKGIRLLSRTVWWLVGVSLIAIILVPNAISSRGYSRINPHVSAIESVRAAFAAYAADASGNTFPDEIANWGTLMVIVNANGGDLQLTEKAQGFSLRGYSGIDSEGDGIYEDYTMSFRITTIPQQNTGSLISVSPRGIEKSKL